MSLARHATGPTAALSALVSQIHPVFMLPAVSASLFGALLAAPVAFLPATLHAVATFFALYTAHVKDGYVDFHHRGEDEDHPLSAAGCRFALTIATLGFCVCLLALWAVADFGAVLLTLPGWLVGYHHAPQLDMHPLSATLGYPTGVALSILGGFYVQTSTLSPAVLAYAAIFLVTLAGVKVIDDATDYAYDRSIGKRTVAVTVGPERARHVAFAAMALGMGGTVGAAVSLASVPVGAALAPVAFGVVALFARTADAELATMLLIRGVYLFLAVLLAAIWLQPLS